MKYRLKRKLHDAGEIKGKIISSLGIIPSSVSVLDEEIELEFPQPLPLEVKRKLAGLFKSDFQLEEWLVQKKPSS